jgi:hypothetical protein
MRRAEATLNDVAKAWWSGGSVMMPHDMRSSSIFGPVPNRYAQVSWSISTLPRTSAPSLAMKKSKRPW